MFSLNLEIREGTRTLSSSLSLNSSGRIFGAEGSIMGSLKISSLPLGPYFPDGSVKLELYSVFR